MKEATVHGVAKSRTWLNNFILILFFKNTNITTGEETGEFSYIRRHQRDDCMQYYTLDWRDRNAINDTTGIIDIE